MARIAIVTDSTADLPPELATAHSISVVPLNIHFGQEVLRDQIDITTDDFFVRLQSSKQLPKTSQPSPGFFEEVFRSLASDHDAIVAILISSKLSGTVQSAVLAAANVADVVPVEVVDSLNASLGLGFQVLAASEMTKNNVSAAAIAANLRASADSFSLIFFVDTLEFLHRGGRIGRAASLLGTLIKLKPMLRVDEGQVVPFERTRTRSRAIEGLRSFVNDWPTPIDRLGILYSTDPETAKQFASEFRERAPVGRITVSQLSPVLGTHVGPGAMGICIAERALDRSSEVAK